MITFKELYSQLDELKVISKAQRRKQAIRMRKMTQSSVFKAKVAKSKLKVASPEKIKVKAQKLAKQKILNKFFPKYNELGLQQKVKIDQIVAAKYGNAINKMATKAMITVRKNELEKVKQAKQAKQDA